MKINCVIMELIVPAWEGREGKGREVK